MIIAAQGNRRNYKRQMWEDRKFTIPINRAYIKAHAIFVLHFGMRGPANTLRNSVYHFALTRDPTHNSFLFYSPGPRRQPSSSDLFRPTRNGQIITRTIEQAARRNNNNRREPLKTIELIRPRLYPLDLPNRS
jgi:hypothetical protein